MSFNHVKVSLYFTLLAIIQPGSFYDIPTPKFGWGQLIQLQYQICKHYCDDINDWGYRSSRTVLYCTLNCPVTFTSTEKNIVPSTTTAKPIISSSSGTLSTGNPMEPTNTTPLLSTPAQPGPAPVSPP